jgi:hypothetical protein
LTSAFYAVLCAFYAAKFPLALDSRSSYTCRTLHKTLIVGNDDLRVVVIAIKKHPNCKETRDEEISKETTGCFGNWLLGSALCWLQYTQLQPNSRTQL